MVGATIISCSLQGGRERENCIQTSLISSLTLFFIYALDFDFGGMIGGALEMGGMLESGLDYGRLLVAHARRKFPPNPQGAHQHNSSKGPFQLS